ncbi:MAG: HAD family hydrolase [Pseudomonadota bacterium]
MTEGVTAVLFDKDGTLIDFHRTWLPAYWAGADWCVEVAPRSVTRDELLRLGGYDAERGRCRSDAVLACGTTEELAEIWAEAMGWPGSAGRRIELTERLEAIFQLLSTEGAVAVAGLTETLGALRDAGCVLGVATMDRERPARDTLGRLGIDSFFDFVCGADSGYGEKPGPGMALAFARAVECSADAIAVVGDTPHDMHMGRAAKVRHCVGVLTGASIASELAPLADWVLPSVATLATTLIPESNQS